MSSDSENDRKPTPRKRKNYDLKFKCEAIKYYKDHGNNKSKAANQFSVTTKIIREWVRDKKKISEQL